MPTDQAYEAANKKVHPVATQWHHPIMVARGFTPQTIEATGFVRTYDYVHPDGHRIRCSTGYCADHWYHLNAPKWKGGYWGELAGYLDSLVTVKPVDG